ncbi:hypothetical protein VFPPC_09150 [Pochonia chlamydosporia 170]|uniref:Uncharacterized protein n=1 Tax=Pochonia chlamydosporia 170 TaxID=1380566 RepID=A0A179FDB5_METCM|nr:hypothetical protein VFPPC_09150 [Pochonia chlamydosporia 170]OAQ63281.1 hypothetical protein VFPPC_09150 [Pochonia chlamydosporia 170]
MQASKRSRSGRLTHKKRVRSKLAIARLYYCAVLPLLLRDKSIDELKPREEVIAGVRRALAAILSFEAAEKSSEELDQLVKAFMVVYDDVHSDLRSPEPNPKPYDVLDDIFQVGRDLPPELARLVPCRKYLDLAWHFIPLEKTRLWKLHRKPRRGEYSTEDCKAVQATMIEKASR